MLRSTSSRTRPLQGFGKNVKAWNGGGSVCLMWLEREGTSHGARGEGHFISWGHAERGMSSRGAGCEGASFMRPGSRCTKKGSCVS